MVAITLLWTAGYVLACCIQLTLLSLYTSLALGIAAVVVWMLRVPGNKLICGLLVLLIAAGYYAEYDRKNESLLEVTAKQAAASADPETMISLQGVIDTPVNVDGDKATFTLKSNEAGSELFAINVRLMTKQEQERAGGWLRGDQVKLQGSLKAPQEARNFEGFDYLRYLRLHHVHWQVNIKGAGQVDVGPPAWTWRYVLRWNDDLRQKLGDTIEDLFPLEQAGFMKGMLIGMTDDLDPEQFQQFSQLGLTHIIAISGLNVAIFLGCLVWIMRKLGFTRETYLITAMVMMPVYIAVTGASPSIIRAGLMAMIALYASYRHALKDGLHVILLVGLGMLLWEPYYLFDVSFQLSFLVTIGLMLGIPHVNQLIPVRSRALRDALSIAIVAQAVSFPVSIYYFNQFSLLSLAANLCLVPLFSMMVMPVGTAAMLLGLVYVPLGKVLAWLVAELNSLIFAMVRVASQWDAFQTIWATPEISWIIAYYAGWTALLYSIHHLRMREANKAEKEGPMLAAYAIASKSRWITSLHSRFMSLLLPLTIVWLLVLFGLAYQSGRWNHAGEVDFIDVGQGDSILIRSPVSHSVILIDGGGTITFRKPGEEWKQRKNPYEVGRKMLVPLLKKRGIQQIDYLIVSHQDADHIGGLQAVLEQIPVKQLVFNGTFKPGKSVEKLFQTALEKGVKLVRANAGDVLDVDRETSLHILFPLPEHSLTPIRIEKEQNAESIVFLMKMQGTKWLFTGDMDQATEALVLRFLERSGNVSGSVDPSEAGVVIRGNGGHADKGVSSQSSAPKTAAEAEGIDVIKIAHHGSKTSSSPNWLAYWKPKLAVISVGEHNVYGHPNPLVMGRLQDLGIGVLRTDADGEIQMTVREGSILARTRLKH